MKIRARLVTMLLAALLALTASEASAQWRSVPYDAANFTASGSMTWTVEESDVKTFRYMVNDRTMTIGLTIQGSSVSGTPSQELRLKIPAGYRAGSFLFDHVHIERDSGSPYQETGLTITNANSDIIKIYRPAWANQQLSTNQTQIYFTITIDLCGESPNSCP